MNVAKRSAAGILILALLSIGPLGCANKAQTGAGVGTMTGAAIGGIAGGWEGAAIGAAAGVVGGYIVGNEMDKADAKK